MEDLEVLVARLEERIMYLGQSVDRLSGDIRELNESVRDIERWRWKLTGILVTLSTLGALAGGIIGGRL
jgi:hypothetical protein